MSTVCYCKKKRGYFIVQRSLLLLGFRCILKELESLGKALYGAKLIAQSFQVRSCSHHKDPVGGSACLLSMVEEGNPHHFFVATQVKMLMGDATPFQVV